MTFAFFNLAQDGHVFVAELAIEVRALDLFMWAGYEKSARARLHFNRRARIDRQMRANAVLIDWLDRNQEEFEFRVTNALEEEHDELFKHMNLMRERLHGSLSECFAAKRRR